VINIMHNPKERRMYYQDVKGVENIGNTNLMQSLVYLAQENASAS